MKKVLILVSTLCYFLFSCNKETENEFDLDQSNLKETCWRAAEIDENGIIWCVLSGNTCFVTSEPIDQNQVFFESLNLDLNNTELLKDFVTNQVNIDQSIKNKILNLPFLKVSKSLGETEIYGILDSNDELLLAYSFSLFCDGN